ncbi:MAG TPA: beta-L-arabinofuranosidase domain-containing protein [Bacillota bacterium]|nr:beta-L-arabinofuranosidase domain-containing protein [Bacillota bacterium]
MCISHQHRPISLQNVKILDPFWGGRIELIAKKVIPYQWDALNDNIPEAEPSHAIENFRIAAGETQGEFKGMVFQDSDVAKWLEASSYSLVTHPSPELETIIDETVDLMGKAQQPDGYLNTYYSVAEPAKRWKDFTFGHELYCAGHLMEAAVAYYDATGKRKLLEIMCRYADYIDSVIGPEEHKMKVYCGHEEIELALFKLYKATGIERYLKLSQFFIMERGQGPSFLKNEPTFGNGFNTKWFDLEYHQAHAPVLEQTKAEGHAVRAMYLYSAMADLARETGDEALYKALQQLWENVTNYRMYITGGLGSQGHAERFTFDYDLPNDTAFAETCATIGLIFWAQRMLLLQPDHRYGDVMERALYNGALAGISWDGQKYFYVNPLEVIPEAVTSRYDLQHVKPERQQWFGCACCPPNIARLISSLGQYIYSQDKETVYIHLFIGSEAGFQLEGKQVSLAQHSNYPWDGNITFTINPEEPEPFTFAVRIPGWTRKYGVKVNGEVLDEVGVEQGYARFNRIWRQGDKVELNLEMPVELIQASPRVREDSGKVAIQRGPVIYCLEEIDNGPQLWNIALQANAELAVEFAEDLFDGVTVIQGEASRVEDDLLGGELYRPLRETTKPVKIRAVPYCLWGNRKPGEMMVWIARK